MIYGSVCSGIEAATVAWHSLGWKSSFFSEIEKFPRAMLAHHYPSTPLHGDFTTIKEGTYDPIDLLVGGTPCQSFSIAGLRGGITDDRGNLSLEYIRLSQRLRPRWLVWENVPGVLSSGEGRDFGAFLGGLAECGYGFAYRILDAQYFGVPQRRRRVFVIGYLGDWRPPAAVLFEREGLRGDITPRREERESLAGTLGARTCRSVGAQGAEVGHLIPETVGSLCADAHPGSYSGQDAYTGRLVPVTFPADMSGTQNCHAVDQSLTLRTGGNMACAIPINTQVALRHKAMGESTGMGSGDSGDPAYTLQAGHSHAVAVTPAVGWSEELTASVEIAGTLQYGGQGGRHDGVMTQEMKVRHLTPRECERLQGFPDDYTLIPYGNRGGDAADGLRYKALGNSMAVPVMRWIAERIEMVEGLMQ